MGWKAPIVLHNNQGMIWCCRLPYALNLGCLHKKSLFQVGARSGIALHSSPKFVTHWKRNSKFFFDWQSIGITSSQWHFFQFFYVMSNWLASQKEFNIQLKKFRTCLNSFWTSFFKCYQTKIRCQMWPKKIQKISPKFNFIFFLNGSTSTKYSLFIFIFSFWQNFVTKRKHCLHHFFLNVQWNPQDGTPNRWARGQ
jgi:hypothetical protein